MKKPEYDKEVLKRLRDLHDQEEKKEHLENIANNIAYVLAWIIRLAILFGIVVLAVKFALSL